eukprot:197149-Rhodomonas_salina.1
MLVSAAGNACATRRRAVVSLPHTRSMLPFMVAAVYGCSCLWVQLFMGAAHAIARGRACVLRACRHEPYPAKSNTRNRIP